MNPATTDALLKWLLRLVGGVELFAIPFIVIPVAWMDAVNDRVLGLGPLPNSPITEYLTRTLSAMYALHGAVTDTDWRQLSESTRARLRREVLRRT